jgi:hypothetical protein
MRTLGSLRDAVLRNQPQCVIKIKQERRTHASLGCQRLNTSCSSRTSGTYRSFGTRGQSRRESSSAAAFAAASCSLKSSTTTIFPYARAHAPSCSSMSLTCGSSMRHGGRGTSHGDGITSSLLLTALAFGIASRIVSSATPWWQHDWLRVCITVIGASAFATLVGVYRTTETVSLFSIHGAARLMECTGGPGTHRVFRRFMAKLAAHIRFASAARRRAKAEHLRDEMREHLRLKEIGVLSAGEYATAKGRILDQHSPAAQPPLARASTRL